MKYTYAYKSSDGTRHEASMEAKCREDVFADLRKQGIKAIKVVAADGSKANGEVRGVKKRVVAGLVIVAALVVGILAFRAGEKAQAESPSAEATKTQSSPRHQIYGDPVVVKDFERGKFDTVLTNRCDQMLAWFAQPGKIMCPKGVDPRRMGTAFAEVATTAPVQIVPDDVREVRELKMIVNGMHEELDAYLANGLGTPKSFWRRLVERTVQESQIYERTKRELENEKNAAMWEEKNDALRRLGLRTISNPREAE